MHHSKLKRIIFNRSFKKLSRWITKILFYIWQYCMISTNLFTRVTLEILGKMASAVIKKTKKSESKKIERTRLSIIKKLKSLRSMLERTKELRETQSYFHVIFSQMRYFCFFIDLYLVCNTTCFPKRNWLESSLFVWKKRYNANVVYYLPIISCK